MSVEEDGGLTDAEFTIRSDKKTYQMVVAAPSVTEKRLWVKSILEAQKSYHRVQQQYLQRQQSSKFPFQQSLILWAPWVLFHFSIIPLLGKNSLNCPESVQTQMHYALMSNFIEKVKAIVGRLLVTVMEGTCLRCKDRSGKNNGFTGLLLHYWHRATSSTAKMQ